MTKTWVGMARGGRKSIARMRDERTFAAAVVEAVVVEAALLCRCRSRLSGVDKRAAVTAAFEEEQKEKARLLRARTYKKQLS